MTKIALSVENLSKVYPGDKNNTSGIKALNSITLNVKQGEIFGLLGPNGAGKTTFLSVLGGAVIKTTGSVNVWGFDIDKNPRQVRASIGIVPQEVNLDAFFSPRKLLDLQAGLYGVKNNQRITETILKLVSLDKQGDSYSRNLSGGMKRRLLIAKAMVHQPPILVLDEPTAGVDVELRKNLWDNVKKLNKEGVTIILTTHYLFEAQEMCERIAILNKGNLVALDTTKKLLDRIKTKKIIFKMEKFNTNVKLSMQEIKFSIESNDTIIVNFEKNSVNFENLINYLRKNNLKILDISIDEGDLEDVFIQLTKN